MIYKFEHIINNNWHLQFNYVQTLHFDILSFYEKCILYLLTFFNSLHCEDCALTINFPTYVTTNSASHWAQEHWFSFFWSNDTYAILGKMNFNKSEADAAFEIANSNISVAPWKPVFTFMTTERIKLWNLEIMFNKKYITYKRTAPY